MISSSSLLAALKRRAGVKLAFWLAPEVANEFRRVRAELGRVTADNARLQQEVSLLSALRERTGARR
jgi:hypothetical protein